jgi:hypothetical protein
VGGRGGADSPKGEAQQSTKEHDPRSPPFLLSLLSFDLGRTQAQTVTTV